VLRERILSRKEREEGQTILYDECQWGYYDDQEGVEGLIAWLNPKGVREAKLTNSSSRAEIRSLPSHGSTD